MLKELLNRVLPKNETKKELANDSTGFVSGTEQTIHYRDLNPNRFKSLIGNYSCMLIKDLFDPEEIELIRRETFDLFYVIKNLNHNRLLSPNGVQYLGQGHPASLLSSLHHLEFVLNKPKLIECMQDYFQQPEMVVKVESTGIRRCDPTQWKNFLPWHQDVLHRGSQFLTCWLPMMPINNETAGLDLVPKKIDFKVSNQDGLVIASYKGKIDDALINETVSPLRWRPHLNVGDVLLFDPYCVHRTSYHPDYREERFSLDIRIHPKNTMPDETWKTQVIQLPSTRVKPEVDLNKRMMFDIRHLVTG